MTVLRLVDFSNKDTIAVLRCLLADALDHKLDGVAVCFKTRDGIEDAAFTGAYRARPEDAAGAALRLSWKLLQAQDALI